jgi:hypothetical protein
MGAAHHDHAHCTLQHPQSNPRQALGRSPDAGGTFIMRMHFELLKDAVGQQNAPYAPSVTALHRRHESWEVRTTGV